MGIKKPAPLPDEATYILRGAKKIKVVRNQKKVDAESINQGEQLHGYYDEWDLALYVTEEPLSPDALKDLVCHEWGHAVIDDSPLRKLLKESEEDVCNLFGAALFELVRRNHGFIEWLQDESGPETFDE